MKPVKYNMFAKQASFYSSLKLYNFSLGFMTDSRGTKHSRFKGYSYAALFLMSMFFIGIASLSTPVYAEVVEGVPGTPSCILDITKDIDDVKYTDLNCTANDLGVNNPIVTVIKACNFPGDVATLNVTTDLTVTSDTRYDIGFWISVDGDPNSDGSKTGICTAINLDNSITDADGNSINLDGNSCGDVKNTGKPFDIVGANLGSFSLPCIDTNNDGYIDVPAIIAYKQAKGSCGGALDAYPPNKAKCQANLSWTFDVPVPGQIIVTKATIPANAQVFDFNLKGPILDPLPTTGGFEGDHDFQLANMESFDSATFTGGLTPGIYTLEETPFVGYTSSIVCTSSVDGSSVDPSTIDLKAGEIVTCNVTNTQDGVLAIVKRTLGNPVETFSFTAEGASGGPVPFTITTAADALGNGFGTESVDIGNGGTFTLTEDLLGGWDLTSLSCIGGSNFSPDLGAGSFDITIDQGDTVTCTFENTERGKIIIAKTTDPVSANPFVFTHDADGTTVPTPTFTLNAGTPELFLDVVPGTITVVETDPTPGYQLTNLECVDGIPSGTTSTSNVQTRTATIELDPGEEVICTFTNHELVQVTLKKEWLGAVVNDISLLGMEGANGPVSVVSTATGVDGVDETNTIMLAAQVGEVIDLVEILDAANVGEYTVSFECNATTNAPVYTDGEQTATLLIDASDQPILCTYTNTNHANLTLVKTVKNDHGGTAPNTAWTLRAAGPTQLSGVGGVVATSVLPGSYTLSENAGPAGYTAGDWSCTAGSLNGSSLELEPGDVAICTIINSDVAPQLTLIKSVTNNNGGDAAPDDFLLTVAGTGVISGVKNAYTANTPLAIDETLLTGYTFVSIAGAGCPVALGGSVTLDLGADITCTITNDDVAPQLTLVKSVTNDNGGNAQPNDFLLTVGGAGVASGAKNTYEANTPLALNETLLAGYTFVSLTGDAKCPAVLGGTVTLDPGDDISCTIINDDVAPQLTLVKSVTNNNGGNAAPDDFLLTVAGTGVASGVKNAYMANTPLAIDETLLTGYTFVSITGAGCPQALGGTVTLAPGADITCMITNDDVAPQLTLVKSVTNDNGGNAQPNDFLLTVGGAGVTSGAKNTYEANTPLALNETLLAGYTFVSITGDAKCPAVLGGTVTLDPGDDISCTIINDDVAPQLTLVKSVTNDNGGNAAPDDFLLTVDGTGVTSGAKNDYEANTPLVLNETLLAGYTFVSLTGDAKCPAVLGGTVTLAPGDDISCTIINDDVAPQLTLVKSVTNDNGGNAAPDDFLLTVDGTGVTSGAKNDYEANTPLALNETLFAGYTFISITGDAKCPASLGGTVTLSPGDDISCTINNNDDPVVAPPMNIPVNNKLALILLSLMLLITASYFRPELFKRRF